MSAREPQQQCLSRPWPPQPDPGPAPAFAGRALPDPWASANPSCRRFLKSCPLSPPRTNRNASQRPGVSPGPGRSSCVVSSSVDGLGWPASPRGWSASVQDRPGGTAALGGTHASRGSPASRKGGWGLELAPCPPGRGPLSQGPSCPAPQATRIGSLFCSALHKSCTLLKQPGPPRPSPPPGRPPRAPGPPHSQHWSYGLPGGYAVPHAETYPCGSPPVTDGRRGAARSAGLHRSLPPCTPVATTREPRAPS